MSIVQHHKTLQIVRSSCPTKSHHGRGHAKVREERGEKTAQVMPYEVDLMFGSMRSVFIIMNFETAPTKSSDWSKLTEKNIRITHITGQTSEQIQTTQHIVHILHSFVLYKQQRKRKKKQNYGILTQIRMRNITRPKLNIEQSINTDCNYTHGCF